MNDEECSGTAALEEESIIRCSGVQTISLLAAAAGGIRVFFIDVFSPLSLSPVSGFMVLILSAMVGVLRFV